MPDRTDRLLALRRTPLSHFASLVVLSLFFLCALLLNPPRAAAIPPLGVNGDADWVNLINGLSGWTDPHTSAAAPEDANGWPMSDVQIVPLDLRHNMPWNGPDPGAVNPDVSGTYHLLFHGQATIAGSTEDSVPVGVQHQTYHASTNTTTADLVMPPNHWLMILTFTDTRRTASSPVNSGFTGMRLIRPGYPANTGQVFTNGTLNAYGPAFGAIRMLGPDATNSYQNFQGTSLINVFWSDRVKVTDAYQNGTQRENSQTAPGHAGHGWAWEYMIELCNQTHHDIWLNIPAGATDNYVTQLAKLLKDGNKSTPGLAPDLHIYVEYSNEVWNFAFPQYVWNSLAAQNEVAAGHSPLNNDGATDPATWAARRYGKRLIEISKLFQAVYGAQALNTSIRPVFLWQYDTEYQAGVFGPGTDTVLEWMRKNYGPLKNYLYGLGVAPYYGAQDTSTVDNVFATMWTDSDQTRARFIAWQTLATYYGLKQVGYESGPSLTTGNGGIATRDPRMTESEVHHFLDNWFAVGGDLVNFFAQRGSVSPWGNWLLVEDYDHLVTPKMEGALQILQANDPPLTAGHVLPTTPGQKISLEASQYAQTGYRPGQRETITPYAFRDYLLRASGTGTYVFALFGQQDSKAIQAQLLVDDRFLGSVQMPVGNDGASRSYRTTLGPGLHTLRVRYVYSTGMGSDHAEPLSISIALSSGGGPAMVPSAPTNPQVVTASNKAVGLLWANVTTATGYRVYRSQTSGSGYALVGSPTSNAFTDSVPANGKTYYYVVTAVNATGEGGYSPQIVATPTVTSVSPPKNLKVTFARNGQVSLHWDANPTAIYYKISRSTTRGSGYNVVTSQLGTDFTEGNGGPFNGGGLTNGTTYYYVVSSVNAFGESLSSTEVAATPVSSVPTAPTGLQAVAANGRVTLKWQPTPGQSPQFWPMQYTIYRSPASSGPYAALFNTSVTNGTDVGLTNGTTYYYVVTANNGVGASAYSKAVSATPSSEGVISINAGGAATGSFVADEDYSGGQVISTKAIIDTRLIEKPAPQSVYRTARMGEIRYTLTGLEPNGLYTLRLRFAEIDPNVTAVGQRVFDVTINDGQTLVGYDILRRTGAQNRAVEERIPIFASSDGTLDVVLHGVQGSPILNGLDVY